MLCTWVAAVALAAPLNASFVVAEAELNPIDRRLFGQFLERPSWGGEIGIEAAMTAEGILDSRVSRLIEKLRPSVIRFPHGTDLDYTDWRDMVTGVSGRESERPVTRGKQVGDLTNRFGFDEFLQLCEKLKAEALIPLRTRAAMLGQAEILAEADDGAKLVAYCTGEPAKLQGELKQWAELRVRNGRKQPYRVPYWQIGNETFVFWDEVKKEFRERAEDRFVELTKAYVAAIRKVQPDAKIMADGLSPQMNLRLRREVGKGIDFVVEHWYRPWDIRSVEKDGASVSPGSLRPEDVWYAWTSPTDFDASGQSALRFHSIQQSAHGYPVAVTEWNWNGWWALPDGQKAPLDSDWAKGLGAASFVHSMLRAPNVGLACQSMLVGRSWGITGVHVDRTGKRDPWIMPTAQATEFIGRYHSGNRRVGLSSDDLPRFDQPFAMGGIRPARRVALVDAVASARKGKVSITLVNRSFERPVRVSLVFAKRIRSASATALERALQNSWGGSAIEAKVRDVHISGQKASLLLPPRALVGLNVALGQSH